MSITVKDLNGVANTMIAHHKGDAGTIRMMRAMVIQAVNLKQDTIIVDNPAVIGYVTQYGKKR